MRRRPRPRSSCFVELVAPARRNPRTRSSCPGRGTAPSRARHRRAAPRDRRDASGRGTAWRACRPDCAAQSCSSPESAAAHRRNRARTAPAPPQPVVDRREARIAFVRQEQRDGEAASRRSAARCTCSCRAARCAARWVRSRSRHRRPAGFRVPCSRGRAARCARRADCFASSPRATPSPRRRRRSAQSKATFVRAAVAVVDEACASSHRSRTRSRRRSKCSRRRPASAARAGRC